MKHRICDIMFEPLREAIVMQYEAFKTSRPRDVAGCLHCTSARDLEALMAKSREELTARELEFYAFKAMTTVGDASDFRYFWPRIAELAIEGAFLIDSEIVFGKLVYGAHHTWPAEEQEALKALATAIGEWLGTEELERGDVDRWVCAIGLLSEHVSDPLPYLTPLLGESAAAWANLRGLVEWNRVYMAKRRRLANAFWGNAPESAARVFDWLTTEPRVLDARRALAQESAALYGTTPPAP